MEDRHHSKGCSFLATLLVWLSVQTALVISQDCQYRYIEQPVEEVTQCNPVSLFRDSEAFTLQCAVETQTEANITINWFLNGTIPRLEGQVQDPVETNGNGVDTYRSRLTIRDALPENDFGVYFCQVAVNGQSLNPSSTFTLAENANFAVLRDCEEDTDILFITETRCADLLPTTETVTMPTTSPQPTPSQTTQPTTVTPSQTTFESTDHTTDQTTTSSEGTDELPGPSDPVPESLQTWIYVLVGVAAVFFIIIVILTILCVGLCMRRGKTHDSQSLKQNEGNSTVLTIGTHSMVSNELYNSRENNFQPSAQQNPQYSSLQNRDYEVIGIFDTNNYAHLHRPSPPPLPSTLPNGRSATMNDSPPSYRSANTLDIGRSEPDFPPALPPKGSVPESHVYRELEDPGSLSNGSSPPMSATVFEQSTEQLLRSNTVNGQLSSANGGPYRQISSSSSTSMNESLYSPATPSFMATLQGIPETGMSFVEPDDPTAFPIHEYEAIPSRKSKKYESPVPEEGHVIGANPQTRSSVKSNYETDPSLELKTDFKLKNDVASVINPYDSTCHFNPYDSTCHIRTKPSLRSNSSSDLKHPPTDSPQSMSPSPPLNSEYSTLNFAEGSNYSRLGNNKSASRIDSDFFKGASEISLTGGHKSSSNGKISVYDSDTSSRENSPLPNANRGQSVPLSPPPIHPIESMYNQLTMPSFKATRYPPHVGSKTMI